MHAQEAFQVLSNASLTHYELAYLAMIAVPLAGVSALRRSLPWWLKMDFDVVNARAYAAKILGTTIVSNLIGASFYKLRKKSGVSKATAYFGNPCP